MNFEARLYYVGDCTDLCDLYLDGIKSNYAGKIVYGGSKYKFIYIYYNDIVIYERKFIGDQLFMNSENIIIPVIKKHLRNLKLDKI